MMTHVMQPRARTASIADACCSDDLMEQLRAGVESALIDNTTSSDDLMEQLRDRSIAVSPLPTGV